MVPQGLEGALQLHCHCLNTSLDHTWHSNHISCSLHHGPNLGSKLPVVARLHNKRVSAVNVGYNNVWKSDLPAAIMVPEKKPLRRFIVLWSILTNHKTVHLTDNFSWRHEHSVYTGTVGATHIWWVSIITELAPTQSFANIWRSFWWNTKCARVLVDASILLKVVRYR